MSEHANNRAHIDRKNYMKRKRANAIKTWEDRCEEHPDHQSGMVTHAMIKARMQEEIDELRAEVLEQCRLNGMGGSREAKLLAENAQLRARVAELSEALRMYGTHDMACAYDPDSYNDGPWPCMCGFSKVIDSLP